MKHTSIISLILLLLSVLFGLSGCGYNGNGNIQVENREVGSFSKVKISQSSSVSGLTFGEVHMATFSVTFIPDSVEFVSIEFDENLLHHIKTETVNEVLNIRINKALRSRRDVQVHVHYKTLSALDASGASEIVFSPAYHGESLFIDISGASELQGSFFCKRLEAELSGASDLELKGKVQSFRGDFSGASTFNGFELLTDTCMLDLSGASDVEISVSQQLKVDASGASTIYYKGNPSVVSDVSGAAELIQKK